MELEIKIISFSFDASIIICKIVYREGQFEILNQSGKMSSIDVVVIKTKTIKRFNKHSPILYDGIINDDFC